MSEQSQKSRDKCAASCPLGTVVRLFRISFALLRSPLFYVFIFLGLILVPAVITYLRQLGAKYCLEMLEILEETKPS